MNMISVIIPVHNAEKYIERCINSIFTQSGCDVEVILVNDASTDRSAEILDTYSNDSRVTVLSFSHNKGPMVARKEAIKVSKGEYISFCDVDDSYPKDAFSTLIKIAVNTNADIVAGDALFIKNNGSVEAWTCRLPYGKDKNSVYKALLHYKYRHNLWGKLYKRDIFKGNALDAIEGLNYFEDYLLLYRLVENSNVFEVCEQPVYNYYQNQGSSTQRVMTTGRKECCFIARQLVYEQLKDNNDIKNDLIANMQRAIIDIFKLGHNRNLDTKEFVEKYGFSGILSNTSLFHYNSFKDAIKLFIGKSIILKHVKGLMSIVHPANIKRIIPHSIIKTIKFFIQQSNIILHSEKKIQTTKDYFFIEGEGGKDAFFGYYDVTPFNERNDILYIQLSKTNSADIVLYDYEKKKSRVIAQTHVWNWQQGCRLRWLNQAEFTIVYNDFENGELCAKIYNINNNESRIIHTPLYDISKNGKLGLSLDFVRLGYLRPGYGYTILPFEQSGDLSKEGIDIVDINNDIKQRILSYSEIAKVVSQSNDYRNNYINHLSFSPSSDKFLFFWISIEGSYHQASLLVHNIKTNKTIVLEKDGKVSHYVWINDNQILCTVYDRIGNCRYVIYDTITGGKTSLNEDFLRRDGHPSMITSSTFLTDTYPNKNGFQDLFVADVDSHSSNILLRIYSNCMRDGEKRTDLHPRFNNDKSLICIDTNINKHRAIMIIKQ